MTGLIRIAVGGRRLRLAAVTFAALLFVSCSSTYKSMSVEEKRAYFAEAEQTALADLVEKQPDAQADIDSSIGYAVFSNKLVKIPMVGVGSGVGVVLDKKTGKRTYLKVKRLDVGGGLGVRKFRLVVVSFEEEPLKKLAAGKLELTAGAEVGAGKSDVGLGTEQVSGKRKEKFVIYQLSDSGVSATITVRLIRYSVLDLGE